MSPLLSIKQLHWSVNSSSHPRADKTIQQKVILDDINLTISQGDVVGIIGPNGAGKTSLLKCILQQHADYSGEILLQTNNLLTDLKNFSSKERAKRFAFVSQQLPMFVDFTVFDIVRMGLLPHKTLFSADNQNDKKVIEQALVKVGMTDYEFNSFSALSGGEQQRVLIARALVQQPDILILDEPTNHLDVYYQHHLLALINQLNITVIMTIHDLNLAAQYCQRLVLLDHGKVIKDATTQDVLCADTLETVFRLPCKIINNEVQNQQASKVYFHLPEPTYKHEKLGEKQ